MKERNMAMIHEVPRVSDLPAGIDWDSTGWHDLPALRVDRFRKESSDHHPVTEAKIVHDGRTVSVLFRVCDRYVRAVPRAFQGPVCKDSCVEFFFRPLPTAGYFNVEANCGGVLHASYIVDWTRVGDGFAKRTMLTEEQAEPIEVAASLPPVVEPEVVAPTMWTLGMRIPVSALEPFVGTLGNLNGSSWGANLYKCGDETSRPHWASWAPVKELNFHCPECFGELRFL